jgi:hypothetical protein
MGAGSAVEIVEFHFLCIFSFLDCPVPEAADFTGCFFSCTAYWRVIHQFFHG